MQRGGGVKKPARNDVNGYIIITKLFEQLPSVPPVDHASYNPPKAIEED